MSRALIEEVRGQLLATLEKRFEGIPLRLRKRMAKTLAPALLVEAEESLAEATGATLAEAKVAASTLVAKAEEAAASAIRSEALAKAKTVTWERLHALSISSAETPTPVAVEPAPEAVQAPSSVPVEAVQPEPEPTAEPAQERRSVFGFIGGGR